MPAKNNGHQSSHKTKILGHVFDSKIEAQRYVYLTEALETLLISNLERQPKFVLIDGVLLPQNALREKKKKMASLTYTADFSYMYKGVRVVEDVKALTSKGRRKNRPLVSPSARIRHRILQMQHPEIYFQLVAKPFLNRQIIMPNWLNYAKNKKGH